MTESVACLTDGRVVVIRDGHEPEELGSPYAEQVSRRERAVKGKPFAPIVGITRGRISGELCYAIGAGEHPGVFTQKPGTRDERRLFQTAGARISSLDFSFGDEAFSCTVEGTAGTSAIGVFADDGKGLRTVTEGDVLDEGARWVPGGSGEIVYASAGIGRTRTGARAARAPFSLHRLRLKDGTVEVLVSDAKYDYLAPAVLSDALIYALRRPYEASEGKASLLAAIAGALPFRSPAPGASRFRAREAEHGARAGRRERELVRITPKSNEVVLSDVVAYDLATNGDIVYSSGGALYRTAPEKGGLRTRLATLERVEQIAIY